MKYRIEKWNGLAFSMSYVRHTQSDRYTLRVGRFGFSMFVDASHDNISPCLEKGMFVLVGVAVVEFVRLVS